MSDELEPAPTRFEFLAGKFFEGELNEAEDRELAALLEADATVARRFVEMARMDRALAALSSPHRVADEAFEAAVRKGLEFQRDDESHVFAQHVVQLVRDSSERRRTRRLAASQQERRTLRFSAAAIAAVACVTLAALVLLFVTNTGAPVATAPVKKGPAEPNVVNTNPQPVLPPKLNLPPENSDAGALADKRKAPVAPKVSSEKIAPAPPAPDESVAQAPDEPENEAEVARRKEPAPAPRRNAAPNAPSVATLNRLTGVSASIVRDGKTLETGANSAFQEGDVLRISALDASPGESSPAKAATIGADVTLADGSKLWLASASEFRFHVENQSICPTLNSGEVLAHIRPQPPGHPLKIRTQQGPVVEVVGTVFRLAAETGKKRVSLRVDEGKVLFTAQNVERKVTADEMCEAEDGRAPGQVIRVRPAAAIASGTVLDKSTGKAIENASVIAVPQARRKSETHFPSVKTDAQGKFRFDGLREGNYFFIAQPENLPGLTLSRFAMARTRLQPGEEATVNLATDKTPLVVGAVEESGKRLLLLNYHVRFLSETTDGPAYNPMVQVEGQHEGEYCVAVIDGAGKYVPSVEKPGLLLKVRTPQRVQLLTDRLNQWIFDVQSSPSASVKGRVLDSTANAVIADEAGADANDPRLSRTILTLTPANGIASTLAAESDGTFLFNTNLDAGTYELKVQRFGYAPYTKRVTLSAGQALELDAGLERVKR